VASVLRRVGIIAFDEFEEESAPQIVAARAYVYRFLVFVRLVSRFQQRERLVRDPAVSDEALELGPVGIRITEDV
jgi:hypothetical protein